jgi:DNA topoisomerase-1
LQQDAANRFGFTAKKTMVLAQQLYEGMDLGPLGTAGLITYMRTDSVRVSQDSMDQARVYIGDRFGQEHVPEKANFYKSKKGAQDAHEAIRPTSMELTPEKVKEYLDRDQLRLYELIWNRFIGSQMKPAIMDRTTIDIGVGKYIFRATGSIMKYPGYLQIYQESVSGKVNNKTEEKILPSMKEGDKVQMIKLDPSQHFTQPPPRFTESSLVKALEENGIGRPSTYASIMSTILTKDYVRKDSNKFFATELGILVTDLLVEFFADILNVEFTANMEDLLDGVEEGKKDWVDILNGFYKPFQEDLAKAKKEMRNLKAQAVETEKKCDQCGSMMVIKWGRNGEFLACSTYPKCRSTQEFTRDDGGKIVLVEDEDTGETCEKCQKPMVVKKGRFGVFIACSGYPDCKNTKAMTTGVACPEKGCEGELAIRYSRKGKVFYSCNTYPKCKFAIWDKPIAQACPLCDAKFLVEKTTKKSGTTQKCLQCDYKMAVVDE